MAEPGVQRAMAGPKAAGHLAVVGAVGLGLIATACGSRSPAETQAADAVPWAATPTQVMSTPTPLTVTPGTPACDASQLRGHYTGGQGLSGEQIVTSFVLADTSTQPCTLDGVPEVRLYGSGNQEIAVHETPGPPAAPSPTSGPVLLLPGLSPLTSPTPPGEAFVDLVWSSEDVASGSVSCPTSLRTASSVGFYIGGTWVPVASRPGPRAPAIKPCSGQVQVSPFQPIAPAAPPPVSLGARISAPTSVTGGDTLHYSIWLSNSTRQTVDLPKVCAAYAETLGSNDYKLVRKYELNCSDAKPLASGAEERFRMEVPTVAVPRKTKVTLYWSFIVGGLGLRDGPAIASVTIEPKAPN